MSDKTDHPPVPEAFAALGVRSSLLKSLADLSFTTPSDIQLLLIPKALEGHDILGQARTGTGKTAAFGIPVLQKATKGLATQAIILVPTRELCVQVDSEIKRLGQFTPIRCVPVYGGQKIMAQMKFLKHGPEILVGTPGRVIDLLDRRIINFDNIRFVVLDEVDRMLDIGFRDDIRNILSRVKGMRRRMPADEREPDARPMDREFRDEMAEGSRANENGNPIPEIHTDGVPDYPDVTDAQPTKPGSHQTMFVSATFTPEIETLARQYMRADAIKLIAPGADEKPTVEKVEQSYFAVQPWDKYRLLRKLLAREKPDLAIVFCRTKHGAEKLAKRLGQDGIECREIHGNLNQNKRDRVMKNFRQSKFDVLVATDLASRGIDVQGISHIVNYDIPEDPEIYIHRVGRTARMGMGGKAYTFVGSDQGDELTKVENLINMLIPVATVEGFEASPTPSDWQDRSGMTPSTAAPIPSRFATPTTTTTSETGEVKVVQTARPLTIGSKIPRTRRHKRR